MGRWEGCNFTPVSLATLPIDFEKHLNLHVNKPHKLAPLGRIEYLRLYLKENMFSLGRTWSSRLKS